MRKMFLLLVGLAAIVMSPAGFAGSTLSTVVDYFNALPNAPYLRSFPHNEPVSMHVHQARAGWEVKDTNYGADMIPVLVDSKNGYLSFSPLSGDSQMQVEAALFKRDGGQGVLLVNVSNIDDTLSACGVAAYDFSSQKPVDVTKSVIPVLSWKDFFDDPALVAQIQGYKPIQKYLMTCYVLPRMGTTLVVQLNQKSLDGEIERYVSDSYKNDGTEDYKDAVAHLPLMKRVASAMSQNKISLKWNKGVGRFYK